MLVFQVNDMTCDHCAGDIAKAVKRVDHAIEVMIDLTRHQVTINATAVDAQRVRYPIAAAGCTTVQVIWGLRQQQAPAASARVAARATEFASPFLSGRDGGCSEPNRP